MDTFDLRPPLFDRRQNVGNDFALRLHADVALAVGARRPALFRLATSRFA
jgi:hypothetical protein